MTKQDFDQLFFDDHLYVVANNYEADAIPDRAARCQAYHEYKDLCSRDGLLTEHQTQTWEMPHWMESTRLIYSHHLYNHGQQTHDEWI